MRCAAATASRRLIVFLRYPQPGQTKTRLIPALGAAGAAALARGLAEQTIARARDAALPGVQLEICYTGGDEAAMRRWLGDELQLVPQAVGDLGDRLAAAFARSAAAGCAATVIIGSDAPLLGAAELAAAFAALEATPLVLGPARDGGYYLIGLQRPAPALFEGIAWSTAAVLAQTLQRAEALGLHAALLAELADVDRPADLALFPELRASAQR